MAGRGGQARERRGARCRSTVTRWRFCITSLRRAFLTAVHSYRDIAIGLGLALCLAPGLAFAQTSAAALTGQTITFNGPSNKTFGVAPFTIGASASSGLLVSFSSLTPAVCTVSGNTVTIVAAGTCTVRAAQAGNATYAPAAERGSKLNGRQGKSDHHLRYAGQQDGRCSAVHGQRNCFVRVAGRASRRRTTPVCTVSGNTVTIVAAGTCTIQASQAGNANFNAATNVNRSFTVTKVSQTITFAALSGKTFGDAPFTVSASASSGLPVSFSSLTTPVCTVSGNTVTIVAVGTCNIQASQAGDATYAAAPNVSRGFAVAKASQTITFGAPEPSGAWYRAVHGRCHRFVRLGRNVHIAYDAGLHSERQLR